MFDLKAFLRDKNISQRDLCNAIGYSEAYVSRAKRCQGFGEFKGKGLI